MPRIFNMTVYAGQVQGDEPVATAQELSETLGRADVLQTHTRVVGGAGGGTQGITVELRGSNDGKT